MILLKTSWRHLYKTSWRCLEDILKTSSKRLQNVLKISWRHFCKTSWRYLEDVFTRLLEDISKTFWRRLEDLWPRRIYWSWSRRLEGILNTSSENEDERHLPVFSKTSSSGWMFAGQVFPVLFSFYLLLHLS